MHGLYLLVQVYSGISHSDSMTVVPSFFATTLITLITLKKLFK
jgi:hypothetical protein